MTLTLKNKKYFYWGLSFISLTIILFTIYFQLGGFSEIKSGISSSSNYSIAGTWIKGKGLRKEEGQVFYNLKQKIELNELSGILCLVDFKSDTLEENEIAHFIGIILEDEVTALPKGLDIIELNSKTTYKASLTMHPLVMPNTKTVENKLTEIAKSNGDQLRPLTIEMFFNDNSVMIEMLAY